MKTLLFALATTFGLSSWSWAATQTIPVGLLCAKTMVHGNLEFTGSVSDWTQELRYDEDSYQCRGHIRSKVALRFPNWNAEGEIEAFVIPKKSKKKCPRLSKWQDVLYMETNLMMGHVYSESPKVKIGLRLNWNREQAFVESGHIQLNESVCWLAFDHNSTLN